MKTSVFDGATPTGKSREFIDGALAAAKRGGTAAKSAFPLVAARQLLFGRR